MPSSIAVLITETRHRFSARFHAFAGNATCNVIVDSDHREIGIFHQLCLDRGIISIVPCAVQVIWRDIQKYAHGWIERGRESDLKRRALDDMNTLLRRRRQCRIGMPILPPIST